jgi:hypothetical protein
MPRAGGVRIGASSRNDWGATRHYLPTSGMPLAVKRRNDDDEETMTTMIEERA